MNYTNLTWEELLNKTKNWFDLPRVVTETFRKLLTRVEALEDASIESVTGDFVDNTDPLNPVIIDAPSDTNQYARQDGAWELIVAGGASELEKLDEGSGNGWRLLNRDPNNFGNIGGDAVDFSSGQSGNNTMGATGGNAMAWGFRTKASNLMSTAGGTSTEASGLASNAQNSSTIAKGDYSHAEGDSTVASGIASHAEGKSTSAVGENSHAEGEQTTASGKGSHAGGFNNNARSAYETVVGVYAVATVPNSTTSINSADKVFNVGNGTSVGTRSDAFTVFKNGRSKFGGVAQLKGYTVSTLPVGTLGDTAYVTDATAPTYLGALVGGGAVKCPVFFNGTIWVSH